MVNEQKETKEDLLYLASLHDEIRMNEGLLYFIVGKLYKNLTTVEKRVKKNKGKILEADWDKLAKDHRFLINLYDFTHDYETVEDLYKTAKDCKMMTNLFESLSPYPKVSPESFLVSWPCRIAIGNYTERATNKLLRLQKC